MHAPAGAQLSKKDAAYLLDSRDDPEVNAALSQYLKTVYAGGKAAATPSEEHFALASKVEKKYVAAQVVAEGVQVRDAGSWRWCCALHDWMRMLTMVLLCWLCLLQNIALPLNYDGKDTAPVKRFVSQLVKLAAKVRAALGQEG